MAILKKGILGGVSKKIGNVVGYRLAGQDVIRSLPAQYNDKNSLAQQKQREKLKYFVAVFRLLSYLVRTSFPNRKQTSSAYNEFVSKNKSALSADADLNLSVDTDKVYYSDGDLKGLQDLAVSEDVSGEFTLSWTDNADNVNAFVNDSLYVVAYDADGYRQVYAQETGDIRNDESSTIVLPTGSDYVFHAYFTSTYGRVSRSQPIRTPGAGQVIAIIE